jgi:hypothetical protein
MIHVKGRVKCAQELTVSSDRSFTPANIESSSQFCVIEFVPAGEQASGGASGSADGYHADRCQHGCHR